MSRTAPNVKIEVSGAVVKTWTGTHKQSFTFLNKLKRQQNKFVKSTGTEWPLTIKITNLQRPPITTQRKEKPKPPPVRAFIPDW
jgi:hypothetical protein